MPLHPRYTKNPFMVNKNMSLAHENYLLNLKYLSNNLPFSSW